MDSQGAALSVGAAAIGVLVAGIGVMMAGDYRGATTRHVRQTLRWFGPVANVVVRVPPWRWLPASWNDPETRFDRQYQLERRVIGPVFVVAGALALVGGAVGLILAVL